MIEDGTLRYYQNHAAGYAAETRNPMPESFYSPFLEMLQEGASILDVGCGSGRDLRAFLCLGYDADGVDASPAMCREAASYAGKAVCTADLRTWTPLRKYDGIWACASLLHLSADERDRFFRRVGGWMNPAGVLYASFKTGIQTGVDERGRYFADFTRESLDCILRDNPAFRLAGVWLSDDTMERCGFQWFSFLLCFDG